ncbi:MAG: hypothetical protein JOZ18_17695, partial [Chloroflexi bacterium]|nr:hypothetical protein [Chloroflexota bacterium]
LSKRSASIRYGTTSPHIIPITAELEDHQIPASVITALTCSTTTPGSEWIFSFQLCQPSTRFTLTQ